MEPKIDPNSLSLTDMAKLLSAVGGKRITPEQIQADMEAGAPVGADGRMNLVHYTAWLLQKVQGQ